jgi:hypothetical protein
MYKLISLPIPMVPLPGRPPFTRSSQRVNLISAFLSRSALAFYIQTLLYPAFTRLAPAAVFHERRVGSILPQKLKSEYSMLNSEIESPFLSHSFIRSFIHSFVETVADTEARIIREL